MPITLGNHPPSTVLSMLDICLLCFMLFNATFNNSLGISWRSVLLVEDTGGPGENQRPVASHWQTLPHYVVDLALIEIPTHNNSGDINECSPSSGIGDLNRFWLLCLDPFLLLPWTLLNHMPFQIVDCERTWWTVFRKSVVCTKYIFLLVTRKWI